ncbi:MAG: HD domain-containing protein, partial [Anaerolineales bacterium]|nr:HD domain-containing protein [Anaerolineales bacterium]
ERGAMQEMLTDMPVAESWMALWEELHAAETAVARLVHDADKLDMYLQAYLYQQQTGTQQLRGFWSNPHTFYFPQAQAIYDALRQMAQ